MSDVLKRGVSQVGLMQTGKVSFLLDSNDDSHNEV